MPVLFIETEALNDWPGLRLFGAVTPPQDESLLAAGGGVGVGVFGLRVGVGELAAAPGLTVIDLEQEPEPAELLTVTEMVQVLLEVVALLAVVYG